MLDFSWDFLDISIAKFRSSIHFPISTLELKTINTQSDLTQTERQKVLCIYSIDRETIKKIGKCTQLNKIRNSVFMHSDVEMLYIKHLAVHDMN